MRAKVMLTAFFGIENAETSKRKYPKKKTSLVEKLLLVPPP
jgi:hypothetical protein